MEYTRKVVGVIRELMSREVTFIFLTIFLMVELEVIGLKAKVLAKGSETTLTYMNTIGKSIRHYLSIKSMTSLATGILVGGSLAIIGVDYPILWGLLAFLLNYIPTIGSIIAAIPGITFSILQLGFPATIWTIAVYVLANLVIGSILEPRIMGKGLGLSTFVVFFSLIFWGFVLGPVGMFLSVPITMTIKIILENNPRTHWIAVMLGSKNDALSELEAYIMKKDNDNQKGGFKKPAIYQIKIDGVVHPDLSEYMAGMQITTEQKKSGKQVSTLTGIVRDQAALSGDSECDV